jgi:hypothetical protein
VGPAPSGGAGAHAATVLERLREEDPDDPFWKGVAETTVEADGVRLRFHAGLEPRDVHADGARLQCHLYDEEALEAARRARGEGG